MKILFIGDIFGQPGRNVVSQMLPQLRDELKIDLIIANGENAAGGMGITQEIAQELFLSGIHVITSGNHVWKEKKIVDFLKIEPRLLRPLNYPPDVPGNGSIIIESNKIKAGIVNLMGRTFLSEIDCPFRTGMKEIERIREETSVIIVDMHGEATSEKSAMGWLLDGTVSAVVGTHTHVQTADERILPCGTAFITDVGMTGPRDSVIGIKRDIAIRRFLTQIPIRFEVAKGEAQFNAVLIEVDSISGKAVSIKRIQR
ncbi:metallophosphoesterase [Candidatus Desantisbacteria bacterium CG1_02_38_46]|uniref:TIGR00282 family metallophosphoesterase n=3 Tax=unclassified Candidatus Desantisiibacteriota TaxID=3106372 RepID=A0A2H9PD87_9BACT|nr:MAG: metallophosphoesterase [Candidatus Desantisbacteria bacterium CG1_02_38_46]PIU50977.1 MAG: TIGR00282 family metallophosphoesterase [Candidatus Desantisbacteria bacterium CG07_land_8_20_14_0_80_39_15]PIZ16583.1 MAG: TIGR00282 family metallophosphoesterase [Candidatus Desantisbacteria bacterium CG_4_10_14_0_8_um_filter_39_17]